MKIYKLLGLAIGFCLASIVAGSVVKRPGKLVIDTDAGGDDAGAILLALIAEKQSPGSGFEIIAITCSYGNTKVTNVALNVLKILTIGNRSDIPVYIGAHKPLTRNNLITNHYGEDGMGDIDFEGGVIGEIDQSKHASVALVDLARQHAGNISILALAPLTNIAVAITLDPNFVHNVERFYIMGSSVHGLGNVAPGVEFNFYQDPESNFIVLNCTTVTPAVLLPWETPVAAAIPTEWRTDVLGNIDSKIMHFLNQAERNNFDGPTWKIADLTLTALILWPEYITQTILTNVSPVFDGAGHGAVLVDYNNKTGKQQNAIILDAFDVEGFQNLLLDAFAYNSTEN